MSVLHFSLIFLLPAAYAMGASRYLLEFTLSRRFKAHKLERNTLSLQTSN